MFYEHFGHGVCTKCQLDNGPYVTWAPIQWSLEETDNSQEAEVYPKGSKSIYQTQVKVCKGILGNIKSKSYSRREKKRPTKSQAHSNQLFFIKYIDPNLSV